MTSFTRKKGMVEVVDEEVEAAQSREWSTCLRRLSLTWRCMIWVRLISGSMDTDGGKGNDESED